MSEYWRGVQIEIVGDSLMLLANNQRVEKQSIRDDAINPHHQGAHLL